MPAGSPSGSFFFTCPHCDALYQIVKSEAGPESVNREVACRSCDAPMPGRDGPFVIKYFHLRNAVRRNRWKKRKRS
jgi:predicted Zn finger-like uncharacterized protein